MHLIRLLAALVAAAPLAALAAAPPPPTIKPLYQINLGPLQSPGQYAPGAYAALGMTGWLDTGNTAVDPAGQVTPASPQTPIPMACISGCAGSAPSGGSGTTSSSGASYVQNADGTPITGSPSDAAAPTGNGSVIALLKQVRTLLGVAPTPSTSPTTVQRPDGGQLAQDGTDGAPVQPYGGTGIRGWLASISNQLYYATLKVQLQAGGASQPVSGPTAAGSPLTTAPVVGGGVDQAGNVRSVLTDTTGRQYVVPPSGSGTDHSANAPALLTSLLSTLPVATPGAYYVSNPSGSPVQLVLCPSGTTLPANTAAATAANCTIDPLAAGGAVGMSGQNTAPPIAWFVGVVFVLGSSSSQYVPGRSF